VLQIPTVTNCTISSAEDMQTYSDRQLFTSHHYLQLPTLENKIIYLATDTSVINHSNIANDLMPPIHNRRAQQQTSTSTHHLHVT